MSNPFHTLLSQFHNPLVRDLAWSVYSRGLIPDSALPDTTSNLQPRLDADAIRWLQSLEQQPDPLIRHINRSPQRRLGRHFEVLWEFYLRHHYPYIHHGLQINISQQTLGEVDFLVNMGDDCWHPLELAVKFYLFCPWADAFSESDAGLPRSWATWIGPNSRDRLIIKAEHLLHHQLQQLQQLPATDLEAFYAQHQVAPLSLGDSLCVTRGRLFLPWNQPLPDQSDIGSHTEQGIWCFNHEVPTVLSEHPDQQLLPLARTAWLSPRLFSAYGEEAQELRSVEQAINEMRNCQLPTQYAIGSWKKVHGHEMWEESERLFVMPPDWAINPGEE